MKVLVACEFSGRVRDAFIDLGHEALPFLYGSLINFAVTGSA